MVPSLKYNRELQVNRMLVHICSERLGLEFYHLVSCGDSHYTAFVPVHVGSSLSCISFKGT